VVKCIWLVFILVGAYSTLGFVWDLADTCNGLIIIPNMIALIIMAKEVVQIKDDYWKRELPLYQSEKAAKKGRK
ncbi:MAG: alanine:cation symporter family protein, partial [Firmicutes bacterium]|nr:alanine:cation symporter family protein [Bacillota bacterium]